MYCLSAYFFLNMGNFPSGTLLYLTTSWQGYEQRYVQEKGVKNFHARDIDTLFRRKAKKTSTNPDYSLFSLAFAKIEDRTFTVCCIWTSYIVKESASARHGTCQIKTRILSFRHYVDRFNFI